MITERSEAKLTTESTVLRSQIDALEVYTRVDNLIIKGLPETYSEAAQPPTGGFLPIFVNLNQLQYSFRRSVL